MVAISPRDTTIYRSCDTGILCFSFDAALCGFNRRRKYWYLDIASQMSSVLVEAGKESLSLFVDRQLQKTADSKNMYL